jgi:GWxTD domain-containing protein
MNSRCLKTLILSISLALFTVGNAGGAKTRTDFYPGQDFRGRAGVLESQDGITFLSSLFPFEGHGDSLLLVLATQVENQAFLFVKEESRMRADLEFSVYLRNEASAFVFSRTWAESLRVETEKEAISARKSIFQTELSSPPGNLYLSHELTDKNTGSTGIVGPSILLLQGFTGSEGKVALSGPHPYYAKSEGSGGIEIASGSRLHEILLNAGKSYGYTLEPVGFYFEIYRPDTGSVAPIAVRTWSRFGDGGWKEGPVLEGNVTSGTSSFTVDLQAASLEIGEGVFKVEVQDAAGSLVACDSTRFFVSLTEEWILSDYDDAITYLDYILTSREKKRFKEARGEERRTLWREFWKERDPIPATPQNERLIEYFRRIQVANARFASHILEGWKTDMGKVYVLLGPPAEVYLTERAQILEKVEIWLYDQSLGFQLTLYFTDRGHTGLYWLANEEDLQQALSRMRKK